MSLYINKIGSGSKIVLLHGWGFNSAVWHEVVDELKDRHELIVIDLPGFGYSSTYNSDYQLSSLTEEIAAIIDDECVLVGWSMGGIIAQQIALKYPEKIKKLVLLACNAQFVASARWLHGIRKEIFTTFSKNLLDDYQKTLHRFLMLQARGGENVRETVRELKQRLFAHGEPNQQALSNGLLLLQESSFIDNLGRLVLPTLIIQGRLDALVPASSGHEMLKRLPNGTLYQFQHAAHAPFISHTREFTNMITIFAS